MKPRLMTVCWSHSGGITSQIVEFDSEKEADDVYDDIMEDANAGLSYDRWTAIKLYHPSI